MSISWDDLHEFEDLAAGSFGVLQKADYLGTEVAVKEFLDLSGQPGFDLKKYIGREVEILQATRHPNVVQFMGCCLHDNKLYLVTEFVPGGNLKRWIKDSQKDFGWRLRVGFATDVSRALSYLHAHKIIHRDLKSENLLITENRRIKICDFGFSREVAVTPEERKRLSFCGTDAYMAPEIMLGMDFDERVDIFSFGVILCEIITRSIAEEEKFKRDVPFMNIAPDSICADLGCPPQLLEIAVACTDADPEKRPKLKDIMQKLRLLEAETIKANPEHLGVLRNSALSLIGHDTLQRSDSVASIISVEDESVHSSAGSLARKSIASSQTDVGSVTSITTPSSIVSPTVGDAQYIAHNPSSPATTPQQTSGSVLAARRIGHSVPHRFSIVATPTLAKCQQCHKRFKLAHKHMECDDCSAVYHKTCAPQAAPNCGLPAEFRALFDPRQRTGSKLGRAS